MWRDLRRGHKWEQVEQVCDVVHSNTPLPGPNTVLTGTGQAGGYAYLRTAQHWLPVSLALAADVQAGDRVRVAVTPQAGVVVGVQRV